MPSHVNGSFEFFAEMMPDPIARFDRQCRAIYQNKTFRKEFINDSQFFDIQKDIIHCIETGELITVEGPIAFYSIRLIAERDAIGSIVGCIAVGQQHQGLTYTHHMKSISRMVAGVCHEINNPLAIIAAATQRLKKTSSIDSIAIKIDRSVTRISKILESLTLFAVRSKDEHWAPAEVKTLLVQAIAFWRHKYREHGLTIDEDFHEAADVLICCQPVLLSKAISNILSNAQDATRHDGNPWIRIRMEETEQQVIFLFSNSGPRIADADVLSIMEPFFTTKDVGSGTGLGLSVAYGIAESHGGRLYCDNTRVHTTFVMELPRGRQ